MALPDSAVDIHLGAARAEMHVRDLALDDYGNIPNAIGPNWQTGFAPARVSFDVVWGGPVTRRVSVTNGSNSDQFAGDYLENQATVTWSGTNLATGFRFTAAPGDLSTSAPGRGFAELGHEGNGTFFTDDASAALGESALAAVAQSGQKTPTSPGITGPAPAAGRGSSASNPVLPPAAGGLTEALGGSAAHARATDLVFADLAGSLFPDDFGAA